MTSMRKLLSLFVLCIMALSIFGNIAYAAPVKLVELDLSGFESSNTEGSGGIVNIGVSKTTEITAYNTSSATVTVPSVTGVNGEITPYMRVAHTYWDWLKVGTRLYIGDTAWEDESVTFSFWIDLGTANENSKLPARCVADYCVIYDDNGSEVKKNTSLFQIDHEETSTLYRWNFPGYNVTSTIDMSDSRGWNHVVLTNPRPDSDGNKTMDIYINGAYKQSAVVAVPDGADVKSAIMYFGRANDSTYCATDTMVGNFEVYRGVLSDEEILNTYFESRGLFGIESPNSVTQGPGLVAPDAVSFDFTMKNDMDTDELANMVFRRVNDNAGIAADFSADGTTLTVTPKEYLSFGTEYILDFSPLYCADYEFTTAASDMKFAAEPSVSQDKIAFELETERSTGTVTVIAAGLDSQGELCGATSTVVDLADAKNGTLSESEMSDWNTVKLMIWENGDGYTMPLTEVIEIN